MKMQLVTNDVMEKMIRFTEGVGKDIKPAVNEALEESQKYIQQELEPAVEPYNGGSSHKGKVGQKYSWAEGSMSDALIRNPEVEWEANVATVRVGFSSKDRLGFMHSLFVMYGVPAHGKFNHGYGKDAKIYNAIRGVRTQKKIEEIQIEAFKNYFKRQAGILK